MKKLPIYILGLVMALFCLTAEAQRVQDISVNDIPSKAKKFINNRFPGHVLEKAFISKVTNNPTYNVILRNRSILTFDNNGKWIEINGSGNSIPYDMLPKAAISYIKNDRGNIGVKRILREEDGFSAWLSGDIQLKFDNKGKLINTLGDTEDLMR